MSHAPKTRRRTLSKCHGRTRHNAVLQRCSTKRQSPGGVSRHKSFADPPPPCHRRHRLVRLAELLNGAATQRLISVVGPFFAWGLVLWSRPRPPTSRPQGKPPFGARGQSTKNLHSQAVSSILRCSKACVPRPRLGSPSTIATSPDLDVYS